MKKALPLVALLLSACSTANPELSQNPAYAGPPPEHKASSEYQGLDKETITTVKLEDPEQKPEDVQPAAGESVQQAPAALPVYERSTYNTPSNAVQTHEKARREPIMGTIPLKAGRGGTTEARERPETQQ